MSNKQRKWTPSPNSWELFLNVFPSRYPKLSEYCHIHNALEGKFCMPKRLPFIPILRCWWWSLSGYVPSCLAIYRSKSIAQTPLGCQQTGSGTLKETNGCSLFASTMPAEKGSGFILCSWHVKAHACKINFFVSQNSIPMWRFPELCPTS